MRRLLVFLTLALTVAMPAFAGVGSTLDDAQPSDIPPLSLGQALTRGWKIDNISQEQGYYTVVLRTRHGSPNETVWCAVIGVTSDGLTEDEPQAVRKPVISACMVVP